MAAAEAYTKRVYQLVRQIPAGKVATYGQIAAYAGDCTPRMVGYALAGLPVGSDVPWQRVINRQGKISPRGGGDGALRQRAALEAEGVAFGPDKRIDLKQYGWQGPSWEWLAQAGILA